MLKDDIARLYKMIGKSAHDYFDFQAEGEYHNRIDSLIKRRAASRIGKSMTQPTQRKSKIVAVISRGHLPGRKLVSSLAFLAASKLKEDTSVHVVDLIPVASQSEEKSVLLSNGIRHVLIDTSAQVVRMEMAKEMDWLGRQILADHDDGLILLDVPEQVMHMRHNSMAIADFILVLLPGTVGAIRAIEETEAELEEFFAARPSANVCYLIVESSSSENMSALIKGELISHHDLIVPVVVNKEQMPNVLELSSAVNPNPVGSCDLEKIIDYIFERVGYAH